MDVLFSLKKILGVLISPLPVACLLLLVACILLFFSAKYIKLSRYLVLTGVIVLFISSSPILSFLMLREIELAYPKYEDQLKRVDNIVVLGCYNTFDTQLPTVANIHPCSMYRLIEAYRLAQLYPKSELFLTGWDNLNDNNISHPEYSAQFLADIGLSRTRMTVIKGSKDTSEEAAILSQYIKNEHNLVVSSASHFKRAVKLFNLHGITFTPVPVEYLTHDGGEWGWNLFVPNPGALEVAERAVYEYLGNIWVEVTSWFQAKHNKPS